MNRTPDTHKTLLAALAIAFASTASAVHVHDIITCVHSTPAVVQSMHDIHDCAFCWMVYQNVTVDKVVTVTPLTVWDTLHQERPTAPVTPYSAHRYGRAPPASA
ncbi:hypothetical protein QA596_02150 [Balneolales bacterium ANBcel1]|nr:hypothetical protein [Balneolales bacterium ANBcel1]